MYRRGEMYYARLKIGGVYVKKSLGTRDRREALRRLNAMSRGFDLGDDERLAAIERHLRPKAERRSMEEVWDVYKTAPINATQSLKAQRDDAAAWQGFIWWLHGHEGGPECRTNCKAAHPDVDAAADFTPQMASEFFAHLRTCRSAHTVNKYVRILRRVWRLNGIDPNPWAGFRKLREENAGKRALTREEVDRLIENANGELRTLFTVGAYTGMRMSDCAALKWESIANDRIVVKTIKTRRLAGIPIHPRLRDELHEVARAQGSSRGEYVMPGLAHAPKWQMSKLVMAHFKSCGFDDAIRTEGKRAIPTVGFHSLRSTFITRLGEAGVPLAVVRDMVGHVSEEMSFRYFRSDEAMAQRAIAALG